MKFFYYFVIALFILAIKPIAAFADAQRESVNVLTWWGYLNDPEIVEQIESQCQVKLSFDEYYSNDEFLRRWEGHKELYDVLVFSDTIFDVIKTKIPNITSSVLWQHSKYYYPAIKSHYLSMGYPHNVVYFVHTMTGFLWNPDNISINTHDSIKTIFKKAANKYVVIIDDPMEIKKLVESEGMQSLTIQNIKSIIQDATVYITNNYSQIYKKSAFAFSYGWSGEAIADLIRSDKKYKFFIHPKLSHITSDLLAQTTISPGATCVANVLSSKSNLAKIQKKLFYFSPYGNNPIKENIVYAELYNKFLANISVIHWSGVTTSSSFNENNKLWQLVKLSFGVSSNRS